MLEHNWSAPHPARRRPEPSPSSRYIFPRHVESFGNAYERRVRLALFGVTSITSSSSSSATSRKNFSNLRRPFVADLTLLRTPRTLDDLAARRAPLRDERIILGHRTPPLGYASATMYEAQFLRLP